MTPFDLTGRSALVTGAGAPGGIGAAVARALARAGAAVLVTDVDGEAAEHTAAAIRTDGGKAEGAALDVRDRAAADDAVARAAALTDGTLHILVNNAGVTAPAMFPKLTEDSVRALLDIHVLGTFSCAQAALAHLPEDGTGRIINVTSSAAISPAPSARSTTPPPRPASSASPSPWHANWPARTSSSTPWPRWPRRR